MHVLDNESHELHRDDSEASNSKYQLVPLDSHRRNVAERSMRIHKEYSIRMLIVIDVKFSISMWDYLIKQTNITINLLRQIRVHPHLSAWYHYNGLFY